VCPSKLLLALNIRKKIKKSINKQTKTGFQISNYFMHYALHAGNGNPDSGEVIISAGTMAAF